VAGAGRGVGTRATGKPWTAGAAVPLPRQRWARSVSLSLSRPHAAHPRVLVRVQDDELTILDVRKLKKIFSEKYPCEVETSRGPHYWSALVRPRYAVSGGARYTRVWMSAPLYNTLFWMLRCAAE